MLLCRAPAQIKEIRIGKYNNIHLLTIEALNMM